MPHIIKSVALALALASCAPQAADSAASGQQSPAAAPVADEPIRTDPPAALAPAEEKTMCDAAKAQFAVNQTYSDTLAAEAKAAAGAKIVRQLLPGQAITMEFNAERLNLETDGSGKVAAVRCG